MTIFRDTRNGLLYLIWRITGWGGGYVAEPYGHFIPTKHRKGTLGMPDTVDLKNFEPVSYR